MGFLSRLFGKKKEVKKVEFSQEEFEKDYTLKVEGLEHVLGKMHRLVGHAIVPFSVGGAVDMYYFPNHIEGTGFATMELLDPAGKGPLENRLGTYELVAFTKKEYNDQGEVQTPFNLIERKACGFLTIIGRYASMAVLNPKETIEVPNGEGEENTCLVLDAYEPDGKTFKIGDRKHHLLLCMQVFRSEMDYASHHGSDALFEVFKAKGLYPYSDLDRAPVV